MSGAVEEIVRTTCASHCGGSCPLKVHVKDGVIVRIEGDDNPHFRACLRGRAYRQRVYDEKRVLYPLKRVGRRGEGKFERVSWDEALDTVAGEIARVRDVYGPESTLLVTMAGDITNVHTSSQIARVLAASGGYTQLWGITSFGSGMYAQRISYGTFFGSNTRDDLPNARMILMWGWNPAVTIAGISTNWHLAKAREAGAKIVAVDPRFTDSAAAFAERWIPIRPTTDGAMLVAMAYVMIEEGLQDQKFLDTYTSGFERFRDYVTGAEDGVPKDPRWGAEITGVPAETIVTLAREYATIKPAALLAGIAPGRTANGDQYHRIAIALAAMTGNIGIHGGDSAGRAWESVIGGYRYRDGLTYPPTLSRNPVDDQGPPAPEGAPLGYRPHRVHYCDIPDFIERGRAGGFHADCKLLAVVNASYVNCIPNVNKIVRAVQSDRLEFIFVLEQVLTPTSRLADVVLPTNTFMERDDFAKGVGLAFYGSQCKAIEPLGESKSHAEIATLLARRLGLNDTAHETDEQWIREMMKGTPIRDYDGFRRSGVHHIPMAEPCVAFRENIEDPANNPFPTPSGKIEIYSQQLATLGIPDLDPVPKYMDSWEGWNDPRRAQYPLQMISSHFKRRANNQFETIPWLRELERQAVIISTADATERRIRDGDLVRVFNDRGAMIIPALVTERIMPAVVDVPHGAWYEPDERGVDRGGCANVLTKETYSPGGGFAYNSCLVQVERSREQ